MLLFITQCKTSSPHSYRSVWGYTVYTKLSSSFSFQLTLCCPSSCQHWQYPPRLERMLSLSCMGTTDSIDYHQNSLSERKQLHSKHSQDLGRDHCYHCKLTMSCSPSGSSFCSSWALVGRRERAAALPGGEFLAVGGCSLLRDGLHESSRSWKLQPQPYVVPVKGCRWARGQLLICAQADDRFAFLLLLILGTLAWEARFMMLGSPVSLACFSPATSLYPSW